MKKKLLFGVGVLLLIGGFIFAATGNGTSVSETPKLIQIGNGINTLVINDINATNVTDLNGTQYQEVTVNAITDWSSLSIQLPTTTASLTLEEKNAARIKAMKDILEKDMSADKITSALIPLSDEVMGTQPLEAITSSILYRTDNTIKLSEYLNPNSTDLKPIRLNSQSFSVSGDGIVTNSSDKIWDIVFVVGWQQLLNTTQQAKIRTDILATITRMKSNGYDFKVNIVEVGGKKVLDPYTSVNPFPQDVIYSDPHLKTDGGTGSIIEERENYREFFAYEYADWLTDENINIAISKLGTTSSAAYKETGGENSIMGLYRALNFLSKNGRGNAKKSIIWIGNQTMSFGSNTLDFLKNDKVTMMTHSKTSTLERNLVTTEISDRKRLEILNSDNTAKLPLDSPDSITKEKVNASKFAEWFSKQMTKYDIQLFGAFNLSDGSTVIGDNPYKDENAVDRLGHTATDIYDDPNGANKPTVSAMHPMYLKKYLGERMREYEASLTFNNPTLQHYLDEILYDIFYGGSIRQKWVIKYRTEITEANAWRKVLFSLDDFKLYTTDNDSNKIKTTTMLTKQKNSIYKGLSTNPITYDYVDKYYYVQDNLDINFRNPSLKTHSKTEREWKKSGSRLTVSGDIIAKNSYILGNLFVSGGTIEISTLSGIKLLTKSFSTSSITDKTKIDVEITATELNTIKTIGNNPSELLFTIKANTKSDTNESNALYQSVQKTVKAKVDFTAPVVSGLLVQNTTATEILKSFGIDSTTALNLTYADGSASSSKLYIRNDKDNGIQLRDDIKLTFYILDDNLTKNTDGSIDTDSIKKIIEDYLKNKGYLGAPDVKVKTDLSNPNKVNVTVDGAINKAKDNETITLPELEDAFGNKSTSDLKVDIIKLDAPTISTLNLNSSFVSSNLVNNGITKSFRILTTMDTNGIRIENHKLTLGLSASTMAAQKVIGFLTPIQQDITYRDAENGIYATKVKDINSNIKLSYSFETAWSGNAIPANLDSFTYKTVLTLDNTKGDGIYDVPVTLPVNRAGGIANATSGITLETGGNKYSINELADLNKIKSISGNEYVIDTVAPVVTKIVKTGVVFKSNTKTYTNSDFDYPNGTAILIDSSISSSITYLPSIFTGENISGKSGDMYTVVLKDFSLPLKNRNPGESGNTSNRANSKFYTFDIDSTGNFTAIDLAGNINNTPEKTITITSDLPAAILYDNTHNSNAKNLLSPNDINNQTNIRFAKLSTNIYQIPTTNGYAIATSSVKTATLDPNNVVSFTGTLGKKDIITYSISKAGWVTELTKPIVWDASVHDSNPSSSTYKLNNKVLLTKGNSGVYSGIVDLTSIMEYSGLVSIADVSSSKGTFYGPPEIVGASTPNAGLVPVKSNFKVNISMTYVGSAPPKDTIAFKAVDRLGNTRNFTVDATLINNITIKGQTLNKEKSRVENKIIESKVNINSGSKKTEIKATKQGIKL